MPRLDLNALIAKTSKARLQSGRASKKQVARAKKGFAQTVRKSAAKVQFMAHGKKVSFTVTGARDAKKQRRMNAWTRYVRANIGKYLPDGASFWQAQAAMKRVATDWKRSKSRRAA